MGNPSRCDQFDERGRFNRREPFPSRTSGAVRSSGSRPQHRSGEPFGLVWILATALLVGAQREVVGALPAWLPADKLSSGGLTLLSAPASGLRRSTALPGPSRATSGTEPVVAPTEAGPVGPDFRLGNDPEALPADRHAQAEPHLARSYQNPDLLLGTFQEGRFEDGGAVSCGYAVSRDGGQSWSRALIPGLVTLDGGPFDRTSDPVAAVGPDDTLYLSTLGLLGDPTDWETAITLHISRDQGRTFTPPIIVVRSTNSAVFLDKNWLAVNSFQNTPTTGRIVVSLTRFHSSSIHGVTLPIAITHSDDGGETWTELQIISSDNCQGSQPVFLPDGSLAVAYWEFTNGGEDRIVVRHSADGGSTFAPVREVASVARHRDPVARSAQFLPAMATDRTLGGLHLVWQADRDGPRIMYSRSMDFGETWSEPRPVNDTPTGRSVFNPAVAVSPDGLHVTVVFYDKRHDDGSGRFVDLYLAESFDGGTTWEPNHRVTSQSSDLQTAPLTSGGRMLGDYLGIVPALDAETPGAAIWVDARADSPDPWAATIARTKEARFEPWQAVAFAAPEAPEARPEADPDGDGQPNLLEYLTGSSPVRGNPAALRLTLPISGEAASTWTFRTQRSVSDAVPLLLRSPDLATWLPAPPTEFIPVPGPPAFQRWTVKLPAGELPARFLRLGATRVTP